MRIRNSKTPFSITSVEKIKMFKSTEAVWRSDRLRAFVGGHEKLPVGGHEPAH